MSKSGSEHIERLGGTKIIQDYLLKSVDLSQFITDFPSKNSLLNQVKQKPFSSSDRETLFEAVTSQYEGAGMQTPTVWKSINNSNTFTVTTGHQLNLFGGPKYFIYKIISVIKLSQELNASQDEFNFLPIFWMASEDHDFEEIDHVKIGDVTLSTSENYEGPVGRHSPAVFAEAFEELKHVLGVSQNAKELEVLFEEAFNQSNWSAFTRYWVHHFFDGKVVIIDGDDQKLKKQFVPIIQQELENQVADKFVSESNDELEKLGYHLQVGHREINLFYLESGLRERLVKADDGFRVNNSTKEFSLEELLESPEKISPNALLRPVYQETVLPNVAYIGGGGELAYWFQLKRLFDGLKVSFPILVLRDSYIFADKDDLEMLSNLGMHLYDLQEREDDLQKKYIEKNELKNSDFDQELQDLNLLADRLHEKVSGMHRDYTSMIEAEKARMRKFIGKLELRAMRDAKFRESSNIKKLLRLKEKYFPGGGLAERKSSFMEEYLLLGKEAYIEQLYDVADAMDSRIKVITVDK